MKKARGCNSRVFFVVLGCCLSGPAASSAGRPIRNSGFQKKETEMKFATRRTVLSSLVCGAVLASLSLIAPLAHASKDHPEIGFCIDDLRVERWSRDRDYFVAAAEKLGAKVSVQ